MGYGSLRWVGHLKFLKNVSSCISTNINIYPHRSHRLDVYHKVIMANWHFKVYTSYVERDTMRGSGFFSDGGRGGGSRTDGQKIVWTTFFSPQLILQLTEVFNGFITEKTILCQGSRGIQHYFPGGGPTFSRGGGGSKC